MPSHKANKWGTACEYHMADEYGLELARASWKDADGPRGRPWELKATKRTHSDGQPGNFKIYREYHDRLQSENGKYGFAVYRIRGKGCQVLQTTTVAASRIPTVRWHGGGDHRDTQQAKISIGDVF
jgi:hypothetical protein